MFSALSLGDNSNDYRMTALRRVQDAGDLCSGNVIVVTGATGALGKELSSAFLYGGATVVMTGRSLSKGEKVKEEILKKSEGNNNNKGELIPMVLDLGDFDSIETFAKELEAKFPNGIHALVNNAGMIADTFEKSKHDIEMSFQANFVSQVLLTELVLPLLLKATDDTFSARIVNMSSMGHADPPNPINWDVIPSTPENFVGGYNKEYFEGKWLLTSYTAHLARRFSSAVDEDSVYAVSSDPGMSPDSAMWDQVVLPVRILARYVFKPLMKTSPQAAGCAAHLAVTGTLNQGGYYQSGILLEKPLRSDCSDDEEWRKAVKLLKEVVPQGYASAMEKLDA